MKSLCLLLICTFCVPCAEDARTMADRAIALLQEGKTTEAIELFEKALAANPQSASRNPQSEMPLVVNHELVILPSASTLAVMQRVREALGSFQKIVPEDVQVSA